MINQFTTTIAAPVTSCLRTREYALSASTFLVRNRMGRTRKNKIWKERKLFKGTSLSWLPLRAIGLQLHRVPSDEPCKMSLSITCLGCKRTFCTGSIQFPICQGLPREDKHLIPPCLFSSWARVVTWAIASYMVVAEMSRTVNKWCIHISWG